ncbi:MAG: Na+/H+ antiporter subunit E [Chloroflexota bacterium]
MILLLGLVLIWVILNGEFDLASLLSNIGFGFILAWGILVVVGRRMQVDLISPSRDVNYVRYTLTIFRFVLFFLKELIAAGATVFATILAPQLLRPGVVAVPLDLNTNAEITLLANVITLTPGTITLDVSTDLKVIYIHSIQVDSPEAFRESIKNGFEKRVMEVMRP